MTDSHSPFTIHNSPFTILLVNVHSARNAGDAVLNEAALAQLQTAFPHARLVLAMNDPESAELLQVEGITAVGSFTHWAKRGGREQTGWAWGNLLRLAWGSWRKGKGGERSWSPLLHAYAEADLVASCPGNFLYSSGAIGLPFLLAVYSMAYAVWLGKPLVMLPQTVGPLRRWWEKRLVGWLVRHAQLVFVRDAFSLELVRGLVDTAASAHVHLVPDIAFAFPTPPLAPAERLLTQYGIQRPCLGVTLINWGAQKRLFGGQAGYEAAVAQVIRAFVAQTGGQVVLFSQVQGPKASDDDRIPAQRVYEAVGDLDGCVVFITEGVNAHTLKAAYGQMDLFLGSRLHSCIFALTMGVPVVAIQYQPKTRGIMEMAGLGEWVVPIEQVAAEPDHLTHLLLAGWQARAALRHQIAKTLPVLVAQATAVATQIKEQLQMTIHERH